MSTNPAEALTASIPLLNSGFEHSIQVYSTCPVANAGPESYRDRVIRVARWSERAGCAGMLVYADNSLTDPWLVAQIIIDNTRRQIPLVAVQPIYMHPFSVAKMVASIGHLYGRRVALNMIAGGFKNDLLSLHDQIPHDRRYDRLLEYTMLIRRLLEGETPVTFAGEFYQVSKLTLRPRIRPELAPDIFVSGSSQAGQATAQALSAIAVKYPEPPGQTSGEVNGNGRFGVRVGIVARRGEEEAWKIALDRFPEDRSGQITHQLAMKVSDSEWHRRLSEVGDALDGQRNVYWLHPFETYKTFCPYLVGSYESVAGELRRYMGAGYRTYILDIPAAEEEFDHIGTVFQLASQQAGRA